MAFQPGAVIAGKYEVARVLGEGGMGVVYQARHIELGIFVAIKVMRDEVMQDAEAVRRFSREAQAVAMLNGEHVARVLDVGKLDGGRPYMVMEYLVGSDLGVILDQRQRIGVGEAIDYVIQACEALAEAHRAGVVHRDLKPANLFVVDVAGRRIVKLVDFGISRFEKPDEVRVTQTQTAFGTPLYMSPEAVRSAKHADARSDIWALGVILYELIAGIPPFVGDTPTSVAVSITIDKQRPLYPHFPEVPPELDAVIAWTLEKDPARRPQSAVELADALRPFRDQARFSKASLPGAMPVGDPTATTARSMTPGLARTDQTTRTGDPLSSDIRREKKSRAAIVAAIAVAACAATVSVAVLLRGTAGGEGDPAARPVAETAETAAPAKAPEIAPQAPSDSAEPTRVETASTSEPAASASAQPEASSSTQSGSSQQTGGGKPAATAKPSADSSKDKPPKDKPPADKPPKKPQTAPEAPGGNPLIL